MNINCRVENVVYKCVAYATEKSKEHVYIGITEWDKNDTPFSVFRLELKKSTTKNLKLIWSVLKVVPRYSNIFKQCLLCLNENLLITTYPDQKHLLNKRSEVIAKCRHDIYTDKKQLKKTQQNLLTVKELKFTTLHCLLFYLYSQ